MAGDNARHSESDPNNQSETPSGRGYRDAIHSHLQDMIQILAVQRIIQEHERQLDQNRIVTEDGNELQEQQKRKTYLEQLLVDAFQQHRQNGLSEQLALQAVLGDFTAMPSMRPIMEEAMQDVLSEAISTDIGEEINFLRHAAPDVFSTLNDAEAKSMSFTLSTEKYFRQEMGLSPLIDEWREKWADPENRRQALNSGLKYGGYALTAVALVSTFPVGTPAIIAKQLIQRNQPLIAQTASRLANLAADSMIRHGLVQADTVEAAKSRYLSLDEKTRSNRFLRNGKRLIGLGMTVLIAGSLGVYSESMDFGSSPGPGDTFTPDDVHEIAQSIEPSSSGTELVSEVGLLSIEEQRLFMDSMHDLASQNGIDYQNLTPVEIIDQLPPEHQAILADLADTSISTAGASELLSAVSDQPLEAQQMFMDSMHDLAAQNGIDYQNLTPVEIIDQLPPEHQAILSELAGPDAGAGLTDTLAAITVDDIQIQVVHGDTLSEVIARELKERGIAVTNASLYGDGVSPGLIELVTQANSHIQDADLIFENSTITLPGEIFHSPSDDISVSPSTYPNDGTQTKPYEAGASEVSTPDASKINEHLSNFEPVAIPESGSVEIKSEAAAKTDEIKLDANETQGTSSIPMASDVISQIEGLDPDQKYAAVKVFKELAEHHNLDFVQTPADSLYRRLPEEAKLQLLAQLNGIEASNYAQQLDPVAIAAGQEAVSAPNLQHQVDQLQRLTVGGWLAQKNEAIMAWFKEVFSSEESPGKVANDAPGEAITQDKQSDVEHPINANRDALKGAAQEIVSQPGYQEPEFPDVLANTAKGPVVDSAQTQEQQKTVEAGRPSRSSSPTM